MTQKVEMYLKPSCTSCRYAVTYLQERGVEMEKHDLAKERPPRELLERLIDGDRLDDFLNPRSPAYKARKLDGNTLTKAEAIDLILEEPNLMRRPLVLAKGKAVFGWKPAELDALIGR